MKPVGLIVALVIGYVVGNVVVGMVTSVLVVGHILPEALRTPLLLAGGLAGAAGGWLLWKRRNTPGDIPTIHGSAAFASEGSVRATYVRPQGLVVGRENRRGWNLLRYDGPAHLLTLAPTRSGKGVGAIIPNLLLADRSVFCIDLKGENARVTARRREDFGPVHVLDPFGISGRPSAAFNPLDALHADSLDLAEEAASVAEALVHDAPGQVGEAHWNEEAKALIAGLVMHVVADDSSGPSTLATVRTLLTLPPANWEALLQAMSDSPAAGGLVARAANRMLGKSDREAAGVLSSAQRHTHFLDSPRMTAVLGRSDFDFAELKEGVSTVFLVLPPDRLDAYSRWLRLMVVQGMTALARSPAKPPSPVLFLLDEFAALGRLEPVERAFGLMAGYGIQLWAILQDMHQLKATYGQKAGTFLSNAGVIQVFNVSDVETAGWVSKSIGSTTVATTYSSATSTANPGHWRRSHGVSTSTQLSRRELLTPDEVMRLDPLLAILLKPGDPPAVVLKLRYYQDAEFRGLFDAP